jgi:sulfide:quinone oxidoreductase
MKSIVVLGAGTGGSLISNLLVHKLDMKEWTITLIDHASRHVYQPGLLFIPMRLYGYETQDDVAKSISDPIPDKARLVEAEIKLIDHQRKKVDTDKGQYPYDWLVCAMGCHIAPEEVDGMEEAMGDGVHDFYTLDGALGFQRALDQMTEGRLVVNIAEMPIKCPVAPIEFAFLADYYFYLKGIRDRIDISLVTPFDGAFTKPNANRVLSRIAAEKNINIVPNFPIESVDAASNTIRSFQGVDVEYDLLCAVPPNLGPDVIESSGLGDGAGYALTEPRTLKSRKADYIYCLGDNTNVSTSKAGSVTHFEAETVVENVLREIEGERPLPSFDGHSNCFIESGHHKALLIDFNYDMEPLEGSFPLPYAGPFSLLKETHINHMGKIAFKWVYWNMLLKGHLPNVPLMPSHMSFMGKDVATTPQVRHAEKMRVADVMTRDVVTIRQGTSLADAARTMSQHHVSGLPVVDVDGRLIGVLTEADFLSAMDLRGGGGLQDLFDLVVRKRRSKKTMGTIVDDLMTRNPFTIEQGDSLQQAIEVMDKNRVKRLIIADDEKRVSGIVARADLIKLFAMK